MCILQYYTLHGVMRNNEVIIFLNIFRFTQLPEQRYPQGCTPSEITSHYLDATFTLQKMLDTYRK